MTCLQLQDTFYCNRKLLLKNGVVGKFTINFLSVKNFYVISPILGEITIFFYLFIISIKNMTFLMDWSFLFPQLFYNPQDLMEDIATLRTNNVELIKLNMGLGILLVNLLSYLYIAVKFFKVLCYAKLTCEWFPMLNPYNWPFSFLQTITTPYFRFWSKVLPSLKFKKSSVEISGIIALEALNAIIYFCVRSVNVLVIFLDQINK